MAELVKIMGPVGEWYEEIDREKALALGRTFGAETEEDAAILFSFPPKGILHVLKVSLFFPFPQGALPHFLTNYDIKNRCGRR